MKRSIRAFTLVELLIAVAITSLLVVVLANVVSAALGAWQQGRNQIDTFAGARQMLGRIADELKGAVASSQIQFVENSGSLNSSINSPVSGTAENLFFVATYPNIGAGDLCVIAYRLNTNTHTLERAFLDSQTAWNSATSRFKADGYASSVLVWRQMAKGVLEFEVKAYSQDDLDNARDSSGTPPQPWDSAGGGTFMQNNVPRRILVRARLIDEKNLVTLSKLPTNSTQYNDLVKRAARDFLADTSLLSPH